MTRAAAPFGRLRPSTLVLVPALLALSAAPALAQHHHSGPMTAQQMIEAIGCDPNQVTGYDLKQPKLIRTNDGRIDSTLVVDQVAHPCVPKWITTNSPNKGDGYWSWDTGASLKTYGSPYAATPSDWNNLEWTLPGPTFLARKTFLKDVTQPPGPNNPVIEQGSRVTLLLRNQLPNDPYPSSECNPASAGGATFVSPNCFHGNSVTNLHFHGSHVSPQPHQDFVLLNLYSVNQTNPAPPPSDVFNQVGNYTYDLDPFPWNQAPGTHWYHPHKHGSTALQVGNGMSGALLILGEFDEWLYRLYKVNPEDNASLQAFEKVLIVQQIQEDLNYPNGGPSAKPVVNGQASPVVRMKPGEVQRWRVIGGTTHASGVLNVAISGMSEFRQIAQDGVQFAWQNFDFQPYLPPLTGNIPPAVSPSVPGTVEFNVTAGSRMDFLVKAPTTPGTYAATYELMLDLPGEKNDGPARLTAPDAKTGKGKNKAKTTATPAPAAAAAEVATPPTGPLPPLFTVIVEATPPVNMPYPVTQKTNPACSNPNADPTCWPAMPYFLADLKAPLTKPRQIQFSMRDPNTGVCTKNGQLNNSFWINNTQYDGGCANIQMVRGTTEDWQVWNDSPLPHPFHIHINPFQVISDVANIKAGYQPPYVWRDTNPLPVNKTLQSNGCNVNESITIRQAFEDFTGAYVIHCHFLGHEDRGMMLNVETLCPEGQYFGRPMAGLPDSCNMRSPANPPACPGVTPGPPQ